MIAKINKNRFLPNQLEFYLQKNVTKIKKKKKNLQKSWNLITFIDDMPILSILFSTQKTVETVHQDRKRHSFPTNEPPFSLPSLLLLLLPPFQAIINSKSWRESNQPKIDSATVRNIGV